MKHFILWLALLEFLNISIYARCKLYFSAFPTHDFVIRNYFISINIVFKYLKFTVQSYLHTSSNLSHTHALNEFQVRCLSLLSSLDTRRRSAKVSFNLNAVRQRIPQTTAKKIGNYKKTKKKKMKH